MLSIKSKLTGAAEASALGAGSSSGAAAPQARPLWALVDCNNFYASCEMLFRPDLAQRPVVVLSNNDGCIVSRSARAKALGIPMGLPEFQARELLRRHDSAVFSSNYALYGDISARVMAVLEEVSGTPVEQYSIDEAFIRLDGALRAQAPDVARRIRETVQAWVGITVSVGVGSTRTLAKIAADRAKQQDGVCLLPEDAGRLDALLRALPVRDVWGVGRRQAHKLYEAGITNALGLKQAEDHWLRRHLTVSGWKTALELRGIPCIHEGESPVPRRTLCASRSFGHTVRDAASLEQAVALFTAQAAARLRREGLTAGGVAVHIRTKRKAAGRYFDASGQRILPPTADTRTLAATARSVLDGLYTEGPLYAKAGVMLFDLAPANRRQTNLLECCAVPDDTGAATQQQARSKALMAALDAVNRKFGRQTLRFGAEGPQDAAWHWRCGHRSPRVTTCWDELPIVVCR